VRVKGFAEEAWLTEAIANFWNCTPFWQHKSR